MVHTFSWPIFCSVNHSCAFEFWLLFHACFGSFGIACFARKIKTFAISVAVFVNSCDIFACYWEFYLFSLCKPLKVVVLIFSYLPAIKKIPTNYSKIRN